MLYLSPEMYLDELNRQLVRHPDYRPGMRFTQRPGGGGFSWEPNGVLHPLVEVSNAVRRHFLLVENVDSFRLLDPLD